MTEPKPAHLGPNYAAQFRDQSVADAYTARPPYPTEVFDILQALMPKRSRRMLELGCGSGDLTLALAERVDQIDAVDFSAAMLAVACKRPGADHANLRWHQMAAESFEADNDFDLVCAGASLHWMDWPLLFSRIKAFLTDEGLLAIVNRAVLKRPWEQEIFDLIPTYSTNQDFEAYDLIDELTQRELFVEIGRRETAPVPFSQPLNAYVESYHSSNGFSRERMDREAARRFDNEVRAIAAPWYPDGIVHGEVVGTVIWGRPLEGKR